MILAVKFNHVFRSKRTSLHKPEDVMLKNAICFKVSQYGKETLMPLHYFFSSLAFNFLSLDAFKK